MLNADCLEGGILWRNNPPQMGKFLRSSHLFPSEYLYGKVGEVKPCFQQVPVRMRTDLENFHGRWAHGGLFTG